MKETVMVQGLRYPELRCEPWTSPVLANAARAAAVTAFDTQRRLTRGECPYARRGSA